jgi:hypothetical protein
MVSYFSFTKSKTKIAQTPTVTGNIANCVFCSAPPLGTANVSNSMANAVSTPRINLIFEFMLVFASLLGSLVLCDEIILAKPEECNFF